MIELLNKKSNKNLPTESESDEALQSIAYLLAQNQMKKIHEKNDHNFIVCLLLCYQARRACALRALGLLLADGTPAVGGGKTF